MYIGQPERITNLDVSRHADRTDPEEALYLTQRAPGRGGAAPESEISDSGTLEKTFLMTPICASGLLNTQSEFFGIWVSSISHAFRIAFGIS